VSILYRTALGMIQGSAQPGMSDHDLELAVPDG